MPERTYTKKLIFSTKKDKIFCFNLLKKYAVYDIINVIIL